MGCYKSRLFPSLVDHESLWDNAESRIGFKTVSSREIDALIHRYSYDSLLPEENLDKVLENANLASTEAKHFFNYYKDQTQQDKSYISYCSRKIAAFGILFGQGQDIEKIRLLFNNYDQDSNRELKFEELEDLIDDILFSVLEAVPNYALKYDEENKDIKRISKVFQRVKNLVKCMYVDAFLGNEDMINYMNFVKKFEVEKFKYLIYPNHLRQYCLESDTKILSATRMGVIKGPKEYSKYSECSKYSEYANNK
jgi:hypothetical protein